MPDRPRQSSRASPTNLLSPSPATHQHRLVDIVFSDSRPSDSSSPSLSPTYSEGHSAVPFLFPRPLSSHLSSSSMASITASTTSTTTVSSGNSIFPAPSDASNMGPVPTSQHYAAHLAIAPQDSQPPGSDPIPETSPRSCPTFPSLARTDALLASPSFPIGSTLSAPHGHLKNPAFPSTTSPHFPRPFTPPPRTYPTSLPALPTTTARHKECTFHEPRSFPPTHYAPSQTVHDPGTETIQAPTAIRSDFPGNNDLNEPLARKGGLEVLPQKFSTLKIPPPNDLNELDEEGIPVSMLTPTSPRLATSDGPAGEDTVGPTSPVPLSPSPTSPTTQSPVASSRRSLPSYMVISETSPSSPNLSAVTPPRRKIRRNRSPVTQLRFAPIEAPFSRGPDQDEFSHNTSALYQPVPSALPDEDTRHSYSNVMNTPGNIGEDMKSSLRNLRISRDSLTTDAPFFVPPPRRAGPPVTGKGPYNREDKLLSNKLRRGTKGEALMGNNNINPVPDDERSVALTFVDVSLAPATDEFYNQNGKASANLNFSTSNTAVFSQRVRQHRRHTTNQRVIRRARQLSHTLNAAGSGPEMLAGLQAVSSFVSSGPQPLSCLERQEALDDSGVLKKMVEVQRLYLKYAPVQSTIGSIIGALSLDDRLPLAQFDVEAVLETILTSMRVHWNNSDVIRESLHALDAISRLERMRKEVMPTTGVIVVVGQCLHYHIHDDAIISSAIRFLGHGVIRSYENKIEVITCGALTSIINAAQTRSGDHRLQAQLCLTLRNLSVRWNDEGQQTSRTEPIALTQAINSSAASIIGVLLDTMMSHGHAYAVASHGFAALYHLSHTHNQTNHIMTHKLWEHALVDTASRHVARVTLQTMALAVISKVAEVGGSIAAKRLLRVGAIRLALTNMHRFVNRRSVLLYGSVLVRLTLQGTGDGMQEIRACGGVERLLDILYSTVVAPISTEEPFAGYADS